MTDIERAILITDQLFAEDRFSAWLGITIVEKGAGVSTIRMRVRSEMVSGLGIVHGGVIFSFADSALAFASNSRGRRSVALDVSISFTAPAHEGDTLTAIAKEASLTHNIGVYTITITNQHGDTVALFTGTVYRTKKEFFASE